MFDLGLADVKRQKFFFMFTSYPRTKFIVLQFMFSKTDKLSVKSLCLSNCKILYSFNMLTLIEF